MIQNQAVKGISYPKPQKKFIHTPALGSPPPLVTRLQGFPVSVSFQGQFTDALEI